MIWGSWPSILTWQCQVIPSSPHWSCVRGSLFESQGFYYEHSAVWTDYLWCLPVETTWGDELPLLPAVMGSLPPSDDNVTKIGDFDIYLHLAVRRWCPPFSCQSNFRKSKLKHKVWIKSRILYYKIFRFHLKIIYHTKKQEELKSIWFIQRFNNELTSTEWTNLKLKEKKINKCQHWDDRDVGMI